MSTQCIPNTLGHILSSSVNTYTQNNLGAHLSFDPYVLQSLIQVSSKCIREIILSHKHLLSLH